MKRGWKNVSTWVGAAIIAVAAFCAVFGTVQIRRNGPRSWPFNVGHGLAGGSTAIHARGPSARSASSNGNGSNNGGEGRGRRCGKEST